MTWTPVSQYLYVIITCRISNLVDMLGRRVWHHLADASRRHSAAGYTTPFHCNEIHTTTQTYIAMTANGLLVLACTAYIHSGGAHTSAKTIHKKSGSSPKSQSPESLLIFPACFIKFCLQLAQSHSKTLNYLTPYLLTVKNHGK